MIWTTTPWTLPANVAIAVHPELEYAGVRYDDPATGQAMHTIIAAELVAKVMALREITEYRELGRVRGKELEHAEYRHPFIDRVSPIVLAAVCQRRGRHRVWCTPLPATVPRTIRPAGSTSFRP